MSIWQRGLGRWHNWRRGSGGIWRWVVLAVLAYLLLTLGLSVYWSLEPAPFDVRQSAATAPSLNGSTPITGSASTSSLIGVASTLLDKPGGYLSNDLSFPGAWLDNLPSWEHGALLQVRDFTKALRDGFSRSQSQSSEDQALRIADARFNTDRHKWIFPDAEGEYRRGIGQLADYLRRLTDPQQPGAQFYARADNLRQWLSTVESRLGSLSQRLSASVGKLQLNTDLAGEPAARQSTPVAAAQLVQTPWSEIDNVFYEARGSSWALLQLLRAVEIDFNGVLEKKNARVSLQQIIRELEGTQRPVRSPMILNGSGFGPMANHSLIMASYISRAHAGLIDLRALLAQG